MKEKLNNKEFINKNIRIWFANCSDDICKDTIKQFANEIVYDIFLNAPLKDLENLIQYRKQRDLTNNKSKKDFYLYRKIKALANKYIENFIHYSYNLIENVIY